MTATLMGRPHVFERGDKVFLTTPLTLASPSAQQIEEYAFASAVKGQAPNEHIGWLSGRYVEAGRANLNGAMWLSDELALKSLTPMLMPVTVMHDPRTAVGTIADCKLQSEGSGRIDTILAIWKHRFAEIWAEAEHNINDGTMMQSMECLSPSYTCSECGQQFLKLQEGKEQASWCEHLRNNSSRRILQDVCFTGTGLIFGTRGGKGAYTEAHLDHFHDEIAEYHEKAHVDSTYRSSERSAPAMDEVTIPRSELDALRGERDSERARANTAEDSVREITPKLEKAEADLGTEKKRADDLQTEKSALEEKAQRATLKDSRLGALGAGFLDKLGEFTRANLNEQAATLSEEAWETALKEKEELAGVKRDAKKDEKDPAKGKGKEGESASETETDGAETFADEEVASFARSGGVQPQGGAGPATSNGARSLARGLSKARKPVPAGK